MVKRLRIILCLLVVLIVLFSSTNIVFAEDDTQVSKHVYSCGFHGSYICQYIYFHSHGDHSTGTIYDKYFGNRKSHYPNAFREDNVWSYKVGTTGYAKGKYTAYSSIITSWASIAWSSITKTMTHIYT